jgi:hypothetical protein
MQQLPILTQLLQPPLQPTTKQMTLAFMDIEAQFWEEFDIDTYCVDVSSIGESDKEVCACVEAELDKKLQQWLSWTEVGNNEKEALLEPVEFELGVDHD